MDRLLSRIADRNDIIRINTLEWVLIIEDRKLVHELEDRIYSPME